MPSLTATTSYAALRRAPWPALRRLIRRGGYRGHTAGLAPGKLQVNLAILPAAFAADFRLYCDRNPKACPLVGVTAPGDPLFRALGADIDVRTDAPAYNVYRHGTLAESLTDIGAIWQDDLVAFALGCSFTFERALMAEGLRLLHVENDRTVSMYASTIPTEPAGPFGGGMVVSMRMIETDRIGDAVRISAAYPLAHGAPVHVGDPAAIGIPDLASPDWGDPPVPDQHCTPVFWACGVTPQRAIRKARPPLCITHRPGSMLITDLDEMAAAAVDPSTKQERTL
ncbi:MAG: putative hydro-lyase [Alphaproteobacteria bacterium]